VFYRVLADLTLGLHLAFILFALLGGLLCRHRKHWAFLHLPTLLWGVWVEWSGTICPLTPLENHFRELASGQGYQGSFIEHYLVPIIYPQGLTVDSWRSVAGSEFNHLSLCLPFQKKQIFG